MIDRTGPSRWPRRRLSGGVAVAHKLGSASLLDSVRAAFVHGMDTMLWTCGGIALAAALLGIMFLPRRPAPGRLTAAGDGGSAADVADGALEGAES